MRYHIGDLEVEHHHHFELGDLHGSVSTVSDGRVVLHLDSAPVYGPDARDGAARPWHRFVQHNYTEIILDQNELGALISALRRCAETI